MLELFHKMGIFQKVFGSKEGQFRKKVLVILNERYPGEPFQPVGEDRISLRSVEFDLANLFEACQKNETETSELVFQHFSHPVALTYTTDLLPWDRARTLVRPQLFPAEYRNRIPLQSYPLLEGIVIGIAIKSGQRFPFVRSEHLTQWKVSAEEIYRQSIENLSNDPAETEVTISGSDRFIGLETHDGFDAARILMPRIRKLAAEKLGEHYFAGIPNQSFLILWAKDCSSRFQDYALEKVETDFAIQPFPLSKTRFEL
jgi:uncharacterized protein YtpQ (UPF0354 family)